MTGLAERGEQLDGRCCRLAREPVLAPAAGFLVLVLALDGGRCSAGSHGDSSEWTAVVSVPGRRCQPARSPLGRVALVDVTRYTGAARAGPALQSRPDVLTIRAIRENEA